MSQFTASGTAIIVAMVVIYIAVTALVSLRLRSKTNDQFMVAGRSMPAFVIAILLMSEFIGAKSTVGTSQEAFTSGIAASWSVIAAAIGFVCFGLFMTRRLYQSGQYTISGFIAEKYGNTARLVVSAIMIYALFIVNVGNYVSGAAAISTVLRVSLPVAAVVTAVVSTIYFAWGGLKSVAYVTVLHSAVKIVGIAIIVWFAVSMSGGISPMVRAMPAHYFTWDGSIGGGTIGAWIISTVGSIFSTQFIIQAISGAKSANQARRATMIASVLCIPIALALGFIGVTAKYLFPTIKSLYALPVFLQHMSPWLAGMVTVSLSASIFVSVCTVALGIASLIVKDFYVPRYKPSPEQELRATNWISLAVGFLPLIFVLYVPQILALSFFTRALRLSVTVVALIGLYLPFFRSGRGAVWALVLAAIGTTIWYLLNNPLGIDNTYIALGVPAVVLIIERMFSRTPTHSSNAALEHSAAGSREP